MSKTPLFLDTKPVSYTIGDGALACSKKGLSKYQRILMLVDENVEKHIEKDVIKIRINAFNRSGELFTIQ